MLAALRSRRAFINCREITHLPEPEARKLSTAGTFVILYLCWDLHTYRRTPRMVMGLGLAPATGYVSKAGRV